MEKGELIMTRELGHIVFYVGDLNESLRFYHDTLQLKLVGRLFNGRAAALTGGRTHHELLLIEVGEAPGPLRGKRVGFYHAGWKIGDSLEQLRSMQERLTGNGYAIKAMVDHSITYSLYLYDPDGNEIELYVDNKQFNWSQDDSWISQPAKALVL